MDAVLTLIAGPEAELTLAHVGLVRDALAGLGIDSARPDWLAPRLACDIGFCGSPDQADAAARLALSGTALDVIAQPLADRQKHLLAADMESTIIGQELLDELAALVGQRETVARITSEAMNGERPFVAAFEQRVALLAGLPESALDRVAEAITLTPGAEGLVRTMRKAGAWCMLISGGFLPFSQRVANQLGFDDFTGSRPEVVDGRLTGRLLPPVFDAEAKAAALITAAGRRRLAIRHTLAVGDGANDLVMLAAAGLGIAFRAKPAVAAAARARLDHADLSGLLYAQGYRTEALWP